MKKVSFRLISLVLALALCLLPTAAGAFYLEYQDETVTDGGTLELTFTVGEYADKRIKCVFENGESVNKFDTKECDIQEDYGLIATHYWNGFIGVYGTPKKANTDGYTGRILIEVVSGGKIEGKTFYIKFIINEKEMPVPPIPTPTVPTVVDNVIYNAAPEHEQALIRGVKEWCNARAGAGTDSAVIGRANLGQQISLLRWNADESWCFVEFNGLQGWIAKQFILPIK